MPTNQLDIAIAKTLDHLDQETQSIRTGRANPALIEHLVVECYGAKSPLQQVASISSPEPQTLTIQPWDPSVLKDIERALTQSSLGITPVVDSRVIRLPFPPMTEERRIELTKVVREKGEQAKISIRTAREEAVKESRRAERDGQLSEDALEQALKNLQDRVQKANGQVDQTVAKKVEELQRI